MVKSIKETVDDFGLVGALAIFLFLCAFVALIGPDVLEPQSLAKSAKIPRLAIAILLGASSLILFVSALLKNNEPVREDIEHDRAVLRKYILSSFEREAFKNENFESEDLRALYSACNQTRVALSQNVNRISSSVFYKIINLTIEDLKEITNISPFGESEDNIKPDRRGQRCKDDRDYIEKWYINGGHLVVDELLFDRDSDQDKEVRAKYVYGELQRYVWEKLAPVRSAHQCLARIR